MSQLYPNAICLPCRGSENGPLLARGAQGGVFGQDRQPVKEAFLFRRYRQNSKLVDGRWDPTTGQELVEAPMILPGTPGETKVHLKGRHIFAGYLFPHYGHFLLESLSRLWYIRAHPEMPLIWLGVHNQPDFTAMHKAIFELFGLRNPMHILTEQAEVEELVVPEAGYVINSQFSDAQAEALRAIGPTEPKKGKKVWLSRSKLGSAIVHNAPQLEAILKAAGWLIFHPQEHSIRDQIAMLNDAEVIAGVEGSAFHTLIMMPEYRGQIVIFGRALKLNMDYAAISHKLGHDLTFISPPRIMWDQGSEAWQSNWLWTELDFLLDALKVERPKGEWQPIPEPLRNIVRSLTSFFKRSNIIELWPAVNSVAAEVRPPSSAIVTESLMFDVAPLHAAGTRYYEMTTDQFFTIQPRTAKGSLYCFRHQADYGKLLRAFNCSLSYTGNDTFWVIEGYEDWAPASANERLLATIRDQYPTLRLARVKGAPVAVVWQQNRLGFKPYEGEEDQMAAGFIADIPVLHINDIAKAITEAQAPQG